MLRYIDSFDHYVTADLPAKWTTLINVGAIQAGAGRRGTASLRLIGGQTAVKGVPASGSVAVVGVAWKATTLAGQTLVGIRDDAVTRDHVQVHVGADGALRVSRLTASTGPNGGGASTLLGSSAAGVVAAGVSAFLELKVLIHASAGTVTIRVNGVSVLALTGQNTSNGSTAWSAFWLGGASTTDFDDLYVCDGSGAAPWNDVLGDCRVDALYPTGAGATTGWTPSTGANWSCVDETAPNADTDYTETPTVGTTDFFATQDAPVAGAAIYGVQQCVSMKKTDTGLVTIAPVIRHSGANYPGADLAPGTAYAYGLQIAQTNPGTGAQWTGAGFNAAEFGYTRTA